MSVPSLLWVGAGALAGISLLLVVVGRFTIGRQSVRLRPGFLCLVVGLRGHGKSLFVARLMAERLAAGVPVVANFTVNGGVARMESWRDVILAPRGSMVVLDEAHQWAGARAGTTLRPAAVWYVSQARKLGHEVWIVSQHENQIAGAVRDQVNEIVECRRMPGGRHRAASYAPHEFRRRPGGRPARPLWAWWYRPSGRAVRVYDTMDLVPPESSRDNKHDDDVRMISDCIAIIRERDRVDALPDEQVVAEWLARAG